MPEPPRAPRLLDQLRQQIRYRHYSLRTEQCYVQWVRRFIRFHGMRHPRDLGPLPISAAARAGVNLLAASAA